MNLNWIEVVLFVQHAAVRWKLNNGEKIFNCLSGCHEYEKKSILSRICLQKESPLRCIDFVFLYSLFMRFESQTIYSPGVAFSGGVL